MRSDLKVNTLTFIVESAVDDHTVYTPATDTAQGGITSKSPIYNVFSDPSEVAEPSPVMAVCVALAGIYWCEAVAMESGCELILHLRR
jgi:hypothetical protein